ncbi:Hypothetical_protein [Hexamita inflata]|uniref:Hypothetical_protein n=1 Tax=Hexamita inflata TaxID=28002 RepID=A0AA86TMC0_9EUKA|nr:Hypothetical protein HINF_LOCUS7667 [Hexamita inflata]
MHTQQQTQRRTSPAVNKSYSSQLSLMEEPKPLAQLSASELKLDLSNSTFSLKEHVLVPGIEITKSARRQTSSRVNTPTRVSVNLKDIAKPPQPETQTVQAAPAQTEDVLASTNILRKQKSQEQIVEQIQQEEQIEKSIPVELPEDQGSSHTPIILENVPEQKMVRPTETQPNQGPQLQSYSVLNPARNQPLSLHLIPQSTNQDSFADQFAQMPSPVMCSSFMPQNSQQQMHAFKEMEKQPDEELFNELENQQEQDLNQQSMRPPVAPVLKKVDSTVKMFKEENKSEDGVKFEINPANQSAYEELEEEAKVTNNGALKNLLDSKLKKLLETNSAAQCKDFVNMSMHMDIEDVDDKFLFSKQEKEMLTANTGLNSQLKKLTENLNNLLSGMKQKKNESMGISSSISESITDEHNIPQEWTIFEGEGNQSPIPGYNKEKQVLDQLFLLKRKIQVLEIQTDMKAKSQHLYERMKKELEVHSVARLIKKLKQQLEMKDL